MRETTRVLVLIATLAACSEKPADTTTESPPPETPTMDETAMEETAMEEPSMEEPTMEEPTMEETPTQARTDETDLECESEDVVCPQFEWMEANVKPAVEARDTAALARLLHQIEFLAPDPSWNEGENGWAQIARRGAIAAEAGNFNEARAACRNCHTQFPTEEESFRDMFRKQGWRTAPMQTLPENSEQGIPDLQMGAAEGTPPAE
jgi:hypothetical protein